MTGINRVTIKKGKAFVISIDDPDVWKTPGNENSYIIFGKPNMDGLQTGQNEINQFKNPVTPEGTEEAKVEAPSAETAAKVETTAEDLNEEGLTPDNIKMVVEYTKCTRAEAIRVLRETGDDSVNAIMKLTKWLILYDVSIPLSFHLLPICESFRLMINPGFNVGTYVIKSMGKLLILSLLVLLVVGDKILVILDNKQLETTHSQFLELLKG